MNWGCTSCISIKLFLFFIKPVTSYTKAEDWAGLTALLFLIRKHKEQRNGEERDG